MIILKKSFDLFDRMFYNNSIVVCQRGCFMNKSAQRENLVLEQLQKQEQLSIREIADQFCISEPTARRVATSLAKKQKVMRMHGGIRYLPQSEFEYSFDLLKNKHINEKIQIGRYASSQIKDNQIIFLEAGTTIQQFAIALAERFRNNELKNVKVFTNSIDNLNVLSSVTTVTVIGGEYRQDRKDFSGYISEKALRYLNFDCCFIGADGIDIQEGIMAADIDTLRFDELLIKKSANAVILADSSKFQNRSFISYSSVHDISMIITDDHLPSAVKSEYAQVGVTIVCVPT